MRIRAATDLDSNGISSIFEASVASGQRRARSTEEFVRQYYIEHPHQLGCQIAVADDGRILGFQSLKIAWPDNKYGVTVGWGIIGTHVLPEAARCGVGRSLFAVTKQRAADAGIERIDATIASGNEAGLAFYKSLGFRSYETLEGAVLTCFALDA